MKVKVGSQEWLVMNALRRVDAEKSGASFWLVLAIALGCYFAGAAGPVWHLDMTDQTALAAAPTPIVSQVELPPTSQCLAEAGDSVELP